MKKILLFILFTFLSFNLSAQLPRVAFIFAERGDDFDNYEAVADDLYATGLFEVVDIFNAVGYIPNLSQIRSYDAILVQGSISFFNAPTLGTYMAVFASEGGGVILSGSSFVDTIYDNQLLGDWVNGNWDIVVTQRGDAFPDAECYAGVGTIYEPNNLVAAHANELEFTSFYLGLITNPILTNNAVRIFDYILGNPIAYSSETLPNRLDLGIQIRKPNNCNQIGVMGLSNFLADCFYYVAGREILNVKGNTINGFTFNPNPVNEKIDLSSIEDIENIEIYTLSGQKLFSQRNLSVTNVQLDWIV